MTEINTPLGAVVQVEAPPDHLGPGLMLVVSMKDTGDPRRCEVFLSTENVQNLAVELELELVALLYDR